MVFILCIDPVDHLLFSFVGKRGGKIRFQGIVGQRKNKWTGPDPGMKKSVPFFGRFPFDQKAPRSHDDLNIDIERLDDYELLCEEDILGKEQPF